jgi:hypothetical protein
VTDELQDRLRDKPTAELVAILRAQDTTEWRPEVFPLVETILQGRGVDTEAVKAAGPPPTETVEFAGLECVASYRTQIAASLCRMALAQAGIEAWLATENLAGISPPLGLALGVDVLVRPESASLACKLLAEFDAARRVPEEPQVCPQCGGTNSEHLRRVGRLSAVAGWALAGTPMPMVDWRWHCKHCGHEWE